MTITWHRRQGDTGPALTRILRHPPTEGNAAGPAVDLTGATVTIVARDTNRRIVHAGAATSATPSSGAVTAPLPPGLQPGLAQIEWRAQTGPAQTTYPTGQADWLLVASTTPTGTAAPTPLAPVFLADGTTGAVTTDGQLVLAGAGVTITVDPAVTWFQVAAWSTQTPWGPGTTPVIAQAGATVDPTVPGVLAASNGDTVAVARHGTVWYAAGSAAPPTGGGGVSYLHTQAVAAATWTVDHNLGVLTPDVTLADPAGEEFWADVEFTTVNQLVVTLAAPAAGTALIQA